MRNSVSDIKDKLCSNNKLKKSLLSENKEFKFKFLLKHHKYHMKCCFKGCTSTILDPDLQWFSVLKEPKEPTSLEPRFKQVENYDMNRETRRFMLDKLGILNTKLKRPRWCSNHLSTKPHRKWIPFLFKVKNTCFELSNF